MPQIPHTDYNDSIAGYWEWGIGAETIDIDRSLKTILGYDAEDFPDTIEAWKQIVIPAYADKVREKFVAHVGSKAAVPFVMDIGFFHKKGHRVYVLVSGKVSAWDRQANHLKMTGTYLDITAHKTAERELRRVKDFLNKTNQTAMVGGWELDLETETVIWTQVTKMIFEVPDDYVPLRGSAATFFKEGINRDTLMQAFLKAVTQGVDYDLELQIITAKGKELWTRTVGHPEFVNGRCVRLYGVFQDIDEHKKNEEALRIKQLQAEQAATAKLDFLSVMSHEIRTPMNAVIGFTNLLLQNPREDQLEHLNVLKFSAENLLVLINDILDFNKIDAGKIDIEKVNFDIRLLLKNIYAAQQQEADRKDLNFSLMVSPDVPLHLVGDPVRLGQVISNFVSNAIKFTAAGKVDIIVTVIGQQSHKVKLRFEVRDTGIGIPEEKLDYIFEAFSQASTDTTRKYGGTGLGLAICKRLLELVDSQVKVQSTPGKGASFSFELGFKIGHIEAPRPELKPVKPAVSGFPGKRVLITEDNPINVMVIRKFLQQWHIDCEVAENGRIALEKTQGSNYDLILMDLQMPEMDGYDATMAIRNLPGLHYQQMPIIALTASAAENLKQKILASGMNDCVTKPFKPTDLHQVLSSFLS